MINNLKEWLNTPCTEYEVKFVDNETKTGAYIPIGLIEEKLDEFDNWGTRDFSFVMAKVDRGWVASGSLQLYVVHGDFIIERHGAATFPVSSKSSNDDFESTALSLAIANAAKKLGKRFGRHLNGRLDKGEVLPSIDLDFQRKLDAAIDEVNEAKSEQDIKQIFEKHTVYQKTREFIVAVSNAKQILKIKATKNGE